MKHPITRIFAPILVIVGIAASTVAVAGQYGMKKEATSDIVDVAVSAGQFNTLAAALDAAGLVDTLKGEGPFTVFAPTDAAFEKLPAGTVDSLLKPENKDQLIAVLTYHVVPGNVSASNGVIHVIDSVILP
jgi:uncharacterized surface protein with fasciclin (FAS1) repeats